VGSDELLLWLFSISVPLLVVWSVEVSLDIEIVLKDGVCPAASHAPTGIVMALRIIDLWILMLRVSKAVVTGAPTVVLQSEVLEVFTSLTTSYPCVTVVSWSKSKVSVPIVSVAPDVGVISVLLVDVVAVDSIGPSATHSFSFRGVSIVAVLVVNLRVLILW